MPIKILMPALSPTMTHGNLAKWLKKEGDVIKAGQILAEIETDKALMEVEAVDEGVLAKILINEGSENVEVNSPIAVILEDGEDKSVLEEFLKSLNNGDKSEAVIKSSDENLPDKPSQIKEEIIEEQLKAVNQNAQNRVFASPLAKRIAKEREIDLKLIQGTGPCGRIVKTDIENYKGNSALINTIYRDLQEYKLIPNSSVRKIIAKRLLEAKQNIPHFYLSIECRVDKLSEIRSDINSSFDSKDHKLSINDFIILACAKSLKDVKEVNASFEHDSIRIYNNIDISVAVATNDGLITPIIKNADQKNITAISKEMKSLARKAKDNKLRPDEFQGGGFTISNLGMFNIDNFSAIINPPQSCILAVGASKKIPVVENDQVIIANIMKVTLSCDHRVVDGVLGARFLSVFKGYIERPSLMLI